MLKTLYLTKESSLAAPFVYVHWKGPWITFFWVSPLEVPLRYAPLNMFIGSAQGVQRSFKTHTELKH